MIFEHSLFHKELLYPFAFHRKEVPAMSKKRIRHDNAQKMVFEY